MNIMLCLVYIVRVTLDSSSQDSVRTLVLDSIKSFVEMICSACMSVVDLPADYEWTLPLTESPYKYVCLK